MCTRLAVVYCLCLWFLAAHGKKYPPRGISLHVKNPLQESQHHVQDRIACDFSLSLLTHGIGGMWMNIYLSRKLVASMLVQELCDSGIVNALFQCQGAILEGLPVGVNELRLNLSPFSDTLPANQSTEFEFDGQTYNLTTAPWEPVIKTVLFYVFDDGSDHEAERQRQQASLDLATRLGLEDASMLLDIVAPANASVLADGPRKVLCAVCVVDGLPESQISFEFTISGVPISTDVPISKMRLADGCYGFPSLLSADFHTFSAQLLVSGVLLGPRKSVFFKVVPAVAPNFCYVRRWARILETELPGSGGYDNQPHSLCGQYPSPECSAVNVCSHTVSPRGEQGHTDFVLFWEARDSTMPADITVFFTDDHIRLYDLEMLERAPGEAWVGMGYENILYYEWLPDAKGMMDLDWTIGYDPELFDMHTVHFPSDPSVLWEPPLPLSQRDKVPIVWFGSNCITHNSRTEFVEELMKYIEVDSFGACLRNKVPPQFEDEGGILWADKYRLRHKIKSTVVPRYKFTIAFENACVPHYVTEKLYEPLQFGSVPIYLGAPNVADYWPVPHSYILASDFEGPKQLAEYIHQLDNDDTAYLRYLSWKRSPPSANVTQIARTLASRNMQHTLCRLCDHYNQHYMPSLLERINNTAPV